MKQAKPNLFTAPACKRIKPISPMRNISSSLGSAAKFNHLKIALTLMCIILANLLNAQSIGSLFQDNEVQGDKLFEQFSYIKAIEKYQLALNKTGNDTIKLKMAESYRKLNDPDNAGKWYREVLENTSDVEPRFLLNYAESLAAQKNYAEAKKWYDKYGKRVAEDSRVDKKISGINNQEDLYRNVASVTFDKVSFNSEGADFAPAYYNQNVVFVSSRKNESAISIKFLWDNSNYLDLYEATQNGQIKPFDSKINTKYHEGPLVFFNNNRKIIFTRNNYHKKKIRKSKDGVIKLKLYYSEHLQDSSGWSTPKPMPFNSDDYSVGHPAITEDGSTLYFVSDMPSGFGGTDIYKVMWQDSAWSNPINLGSKINTEGNELFPFLHNDKDLYFASNGHGGLGGLDIFGADLSKEGTLKVTNVGAPINTSLDDFGLIIDKSGQSGYFSSNREKSLNNDDIYSFSTSKPLILNYLVKGTVYDKVENNVLSNITVSLLDGSKVISRIKTDEKGNYSFMVEPDHNYKLSVKDDDDYLNSETPVSTLDSKKTEWVKDLYLTKDYGFNLLGKITDNNSKQGLNNVNVVLIDNLSGTEVLNTNTLGSESFSYAIENKELNDRVSYQIKLSKEGFLSKVITYNAILEKPGTINLHEVLEIGLDKIEIGTDIGKLIDIKPIYFDLGKYSIREDAAAELDKIILIMNDNPNIEIELGSHTDSRGSSASNLKLSDKRAKASANYIISKGIDKNRIIGKGYGENQLINRCKDGVKCSKEEHQENRRTEFKITKH